MVSALQQAAATAPASSSTEASAQLCSLNDDGMRYFEPLWGFRLRFRHFDPTTHSNRFAACIFTLFFRYVLEIVDFLLKGPWRLADPSRPTVKYLTANDTLNQAEQVWFRAMLRHCLPHVWIRLLLLLPVEVRS